MISISSSCQPREAVARLWRCMVALLSATALITTSCADLPRDPENSLERARGGVLRVGVTAAPPHLMRTSAGGATGPEAELIRGFAASIGADVDWQWGAMDAHMEALGRYELELAAGGIRRTSPWSAHVGFTRPYREKGEHVLAAAPGENALIVALERYARIHPPPSGAGTGGRSTGTSQ